MVRESASKTDNLVDVLLEKLGFIQNQNENLSKGYMKWQVINNKDKQEIDVDKSAHITKLQNSLYLAIDDDLMIEVTKDPNILIETNSKKLS